MENINYQFQENVQLFVRGELDQNAQKQLFDQAAQDPEKADELAFSISLARALQHQDMLAAKKVLTEVMAGENFPPPPATQKPGSKWIVWIAGSLLLLLLSSGVYLWTNQSTYFPSDSQELSRATLKPLDNVLYLPGNAPDLAELNQGMQAYDQQRYAAAAKSLESYIQNHNDQSARVYLGISHLLSGKPAQAVRVLTEATQSLEPPVQEAARWYLALALLEQNNPEAAWVQLNLLPPDGIFGKDAQRLLNQLPAE